MQNCALAPKSFAIDGANAERGRSVRARAILGHGIASTKSIVTYLTRGVATFTGDCEVPDR